MARTGRAWAAVALLAAAAAAVAAVRRVRERAPLIADLAPDLRSPALYLFPVSDPRRLPRRGGLAARLLAALPAGLGRPVTLPAREGAPAVPAFRYEVAGRGRPSGALLWIHGGGMIGGSPWIDHPWCSRVARELGLVVLSVDYRLAPEHPFPAAPEDCFTALAWLHEHAAALGVDPARIAVGGGSAGGGLAAVVSQLAQDRGLPVAFQLLLYPMLDDRTVLERDHRGRGRLIWTPAHNEQAWTHYLGHPGRLDEDRPYASAARRADLAGQPPAWIGVGDVDLLHPEDVAYARRLEEAGVPVELEVVTGMPHGLDYLSWLPRMRALRDAMMDALRRAVAG